MLQKNIYLSTGNSLITKKNVLRLLNATAMPAMKCIVLYNILVPWCGEIRGEPSTDYSSGQPQEQRPWAEDTETLPKVPMP